MLSVAGDRSGEGGAGIVEMLFHTSLVSLVGAGEQASFSPRRLRLWNTKTETEICDLNFVHTVVNVRLNRSRLIALLENKIHLFDLKSMKILHTLDTVSNPTGVCALSPSVDNCFLAFPASETKGEVWPSVHSSPALSSRSYLMRGCGWCVNDTHNRY